MNDIPSRQSPGSDPSQSPAQDADIAAVLGLDERGRRGRTRRRRRIGLFAVLAVVVVAVAVAWLNSGGSDGDVRYVQEPVTRAGLTVQVTATGTVQPTNQVDVSSELSGIVRRVFVDYNSPVKVGQTLAELDTDRLNASVESSRARLVAAEARVKEAEATVVESQLDYNRKKTLIDKGAATASDLDTAKAALDRTNATLASAKADVKAAQADLQLNETNLTKLSIRSPIDGVVLQRNVEPGQTVASSFQAPVLFTLADDLRKMEVRVDVDEADVGRVREGQEATFTVDAYPERQFAAHIREVRFGSEIVQGVVTYKAVLTTENPDLLLRPGMTATADITVEKVDDAVTVPNAALRYAPPPAAEPGGDGGLMSRLIPFRRMFRRPSQPPASGPKRTVWVLRDGKPAPVPVTVGVSDGSRTQIVQGELEPGQQVIVDAMQSRK